LEIYLVFMAKESACAIKTIDKIHSQPVWVLWQFYFFNVNYQHISQCIPNNVLTYFLWHRPRLLIVLCKMTPCICQRHLHTFPKSFTLQNTYALPLQNHIWYTMVFNHNSHMFFLMQEMDFQRIFSVGRSLLNHKTNYEKCAANAFESMTNALV
jgi:hypothetical protein